MTATPFFAGDPLLRMLTGLNLPADDFVVFGSGPLLAHGLRRDLGDLDVVARGEAWRRLARWCQPTPAPSGHGLTISLTLEVADRWLPGWDTDRLIGAAERHAGLPFAPLSAVRASKASTARPKDHNDIALIDAITTTEDAA
ncbi:hypothetical protein Drose_34470 [Dactylosporangium roseum]|uniref:Uncharacterized protein n=1 Tax=Dactylosporangium roseum TaxID=47989 RepID=A0ABY5Z285_9ACTN|nr:hypothetical protein [Dactylosporangium roseum]UWZ36097.1 hypothetical protein Drose_34370 [Dactylosporangium roseum]UWZ36107.1 hypothetical protein Drose_34420 [Dactylosporangium roseum]UWZ36115.1 hypothetical protein Drose_34470 [Dactylosporangium roseum]